MIESSGKSVEERNAKGILTTPNDILSLETKIREQVEGFTYLKLSSGDGGFKAGDYVFAKEDSTFRVPSLRNPGRLLEVVAGRTGTLEMVAIGGECRVLVCENGSAGVFTLPLAVLLKVEGLDTTVLDEIYERYNNPGTFLLRSFVRFAPNCATSDDAVGALGMVLRKETAICKPISLFSKDHGEVRDVVVYFHCSKTLKPIHTSSWRLVAYVPPAEEEIAAAKALLAEKEKEKEKAKQRKGGCFCGNCAVAEDNEDTDEDTDEDDEDEDESHTYEISPKQIE